MGLGGSVVEFQELFRFFPFLQWLGKRFAFVISLSWLSNQIKYPFCLLYKVFRYFYFVHLFRFFFMLSCLLGDSTQVLQHRLFLFNLLLCTFNNHAFPLICQVILIGSISPDEAQMPSFYGETPLRLQFHRFLLGSIQDSHILQELKLEILQLEVLHPWCFPYLAIAIAPLATYTLKGFSS